MEHTISCIGSLSEIVLLVGSTILPMEGKTVEAILPAVSKHLLGCGAKIIQTICPTELVYRDDENLLVPVPLKLISTFLSKHDDL